MLKYLIALGLILLIFQIWMVVDATRKPIKHKALWIVIIILSWIGALLYLFIGRKQQVNAATPNKRFIASGWLVVIIALLIIVPLTLPAALGLKSYRAEGPSMEPAFVDGQGFLATARLGTLERGDVVIMWAPGLGLDGEKRMLLKRIVALPGERVVIKDGELRVYNQASPEGFNPDTGYKVTTSMLSEQNIDTTIADQHFYLLGDNRANSLDSRILGPISKADIIARVVSEL